MGREEAAMVYLDRLLGFQRGYRMFHQAAETLTEDDKVLLQNAVSGYAGGEVGIPGIKER